MKTLSTRKLTGHPQIDPYLALGLGLEDRIPTNNPSSITQVNQTLLEFINMNIGRKNLKDFLTTHFTKEEIENIRKPNSYQILIPAGIVFPSMMGTQKQLLIKYGYYHEELLKRAGKHSKIFEQLATYTTNEKVLEALKGHEDVKVRQKLAKRGYFLDHYFKDPSVEVRKQLVYHDYKLEELFKSQEPIILRTLAVQGHYLEQLMNHPLEQIRAAVVSRKFNLDHFKNDPSCLVRKKLVAACSQLDFTTQNPEPKKITNPRKIHEKSLLFHQVNPQNFLQTKSADYLTHEHPRIKEVFEETKGFLKNLLHPIYINENITIANSYTYQGKTDVEALKKNILKANDLALEKDIHFYILENMKSEMSKDEWAEIKEFAGKNTKAVFITFNFAERI